LTFSSGTFKTPVIVSNTASSTSTQSGAVIVTGGMGVGGTVYASSFVTQGGLGSISGVAFITTLNLTATNTVSVTGTTSATSTTTGALTVVGGVGIGGDIYVGGRLIDTTSGLAYGVFTTGTTSTFVISNTTTSTGTTTGALVVTGGVGIGGNLYIGGQIIGAGGQAIGSNSTGTTSTFIVLNTTASTSTNTGALQVRGGVGIGGSVYIANTSYIDGAQIITSATIASFSAAVTGTTGTTSTFLISNTTNSTSTTTGALQVRGGAGIGGNVFIGGTVTGGGIRTSSTSTPPANPTVGDIWYNTNTDDIYRWTSDGVSSYWLDYTGPTVANTTVVSYLTWTTVTRPLFPSVGMVGFNTSLGGVEIYNGTAWTMISGGPAFHAHLFSSTQSITGGSSTKFIATTKLYDTAGAFNNTASPVTLNGLTVPAYSFMPPVAGYYQLSGMVQMANNSTVNTVDFFRNNSFDQNNGLRGFLGTSQGPATSGVMYLNGTTDYVDMRIYANTTVSLMSQAGANYFQAVFVRGA
jgi:hypothetical protein